MDCIKESKICEKGQECQQGISTWSKSRPHSGTLQISDEGLRVYDQVLTPGVKGNK